MRQSSTYHLDENWIRARTGRVKRRIAIEVIGTAIFSILAFAYGAWYFIGGLVVVAMFLIGDLLYEARRKNDDSSTSIEVNSSGLSFRGSHHNAVNISWNEISIRDREVKQGRLTAVVLNVGGGGPDFRVEGYADLEGLYRIIKERAKDDA